MKKNNQRMPVPFPSQHNLRPPAPSNIWDWQSYKTWRDVIWELLSDVVNEEVRAEFLKTPPKYIVSDDLSWFDNLIYQVRGIVFDAEYDLPERLKTRYTAMRAIHGTRALSVTPYYEEGFRVLNLETAHAQARRIFLSGKFPELNDLDLAAAINQINPDTREGHVYFEANEKLLIEHGAHYMLYGSEYLIGLAVRLSPSQHKNYNDYRQELKNIGTPTVFVCDVPLPLLNSHTLREFAGMAIEMIFEELLYGPDGLDHEDRGAGFSIIQPLPAHCIVGHYHPRGLRDPLLY